MVVEDAATVERIATLICQPDDDVVGVSGGLTSWSEEVR